MLQKYNSAFNLILFAFHFCYLAQFQCVIFVSLCVNPNGVVG